MFKYNAIEYTDNQQNILSRPLKLDDRVVNYILGVNYRNSILDGLVEVYPPPQKEKEKNQHGNQEAKIPSFEALKTKLMNYLDKDFQNGYR